MKKSFLFIALWCGALLVSANTYTVTNNNDAGAGSLRQAILDANANPGPDDIVFSGAFIITLDAALTITSGNGDATTIDGDIDGDDIPDITLQSSNSINGIVINGANCIIRHLHMRSFSNAGTAAILVDGSSANDNEIYGCRLGVAPSGNATDVTNHSGIYINNGASGTLIGDGTLAGANVLGNNSFGIRIGGNSSGTIVSGNYIGIGLDGDTPVPNTRGIDIFSSSGTQVGVVGDNFNLISSNTGDGIRVNSSINTTIQNNYIGVDINGLLDRGNGAGINLLNGSDNCQVGGTVEDSENIIAGNSGHGVEIQDSDNAVVIGNIIGLGEDGDTPLANNQGVRIGGTSSNTQIGSSADPNVISANSTGVSIGAGPTFVLGNFIGTDQTGLLNRGNTGAGISIAGGSGDIGGTGVGEGNIISGNAYGIGVSVGGYNILGNTIGLNAIQSGVIPNDNEGIRLSVGTGTSIGNGTAAGANTIGGNTLDGILIQNLSTTGNTVNFNYIVGNGENGILIESQANGNTISNNFISDNLSNGVEIGEVAVSGIDNNILSQNSIYNNSGQGILITNGAQNGVVTPVISSTLDGLIIGTGDAGATIEIFSDQADEGEQYIATTTADGAGDWSHQIDMSTISPLLYNISVTQTSSNNTSELASSRLISYEVFNVLDTGIGSLRWAVDNAMASSSQETVAFNIATSAPWTITTTSTITIDGNASGVIIDGLSQPGSTLWGDMVQIDGVNTANVSALILSEPNIEIYGLYFLESGRWIQTDADADNFIIGSSTEGNLFQSANQYGLYIQDASGGLITGNRIGTSANGLSISGTGSSGDGVYLEDASNITIGGDFFAGEGNLISGNGTGADYAINVFRSTGVSIQGNLIGTDANGENDLGNARGINAGTGSDNLTIGGSSPSLRNTISGQTGVGIAVQSAVDNLLIQNNLIGITANNVGHSNNTGISITALGTGGQILDNTISANAGAGIYLDQFTSDLLIQSNIIGLTSTGVSALGIRNTSAGIQIRSAAGSNGTTGRIQIMDNVITGNGGGGTQSHGIYFQKSGQDISNFLVQRNKIGVEIDDSAPTSNSRNSRGGIGFSSTITSASGVTIGGIGNENVIAHNFQEGIYFEMASEPSGLILGINEYFCNGNAAINFTSTPTVTAPTITSISSSVISGTSSSTSGMVEVFAIDPACADNQGSVFVETATINGDGSWSISTNAPYALSDTYTAYADDATSGISEFGDALAFEPFITTWLATADLQFTIPGDAGGSYDVYWENTSNAVDNGSLTSQSGDAVITGLTDGATYRIEIVGDLRRIAFTNAGDRDKILTVEQWGDISWTSFSNAFYGCSNLTITAVDNPDLSGVTNMSNAFQNATSFNQSIESWDVTSVEDFSNMFRGASAFDQPLDGWTVSAALDMSNMFRDADVFDQDLNSWVPSLVQDMSFMFYSADLFDGAIGNWDVSSVTNMRSMFTLARDFNQPLGGWGTTTGMVQDMALMFNNADSFDQPLNAWDVSSVQTMSSMFDDADVFDQDLNGWVTTNLQNLSNTFQDAVLFNGQIDQWDVDQVTTFAFMFDGASAFDQPLNNWTVTGALSMQNMFRDADAFNQDLDLWTPTQVTDMFGMFSNCLLFNGNITTWDVSSVDDMGNMFFLAPAFNQPIGSWATTTGGVLDMGHMFSNATIFNQDISSWDVSSVTDMGGMFDDATAFNQDISGWTTGSVSNFSTMFRLASSFDQNLGVWDLTSATNLTSMLNSSGLSVGSYDATLIGWEAQGPPTGLTLGATGLGYCTSANAKSSLEGATYTWTINDAGVDCSDAFNVTNTNDSGIGSLRWTIDNANLVSGTDNITFNIPASDPNHSAGVWTISPLTDLPDIVETVTLDATSQPGTETFKIVLDGGGTLNEGLHFTSVNAAGSEVLGFYITDFSRGIRVQYVSTSGLTIGSPIGRNTIVNCSVGIEALNVQNLIIQSNYIGTDESGSSIIGNTDGIQFTASPNHIIGGSGPNEGNIISNNTNGIRANASAGQQIIGNYIGTSPNGLTALGNSVSGISLSTSGGHTVTGNVISGNDTRGLYLSNSSNSTIQDNYFGVGSDGTTSIPNGIGIETQSGSTNAGNQIGGLGANESNIIANNTAWGIALRAANDQGNDMIGNEVYCNGTLGIYLQNGANNNIQPPNITGITTSSVSGTGADGDVIHVYRDNSACSPAQGQEYLGTAAVSGGVWNANSLSSSITIGTDVITATATNATDGTSEFAEQDPFIVTNTLDDGIGSLRWAITNAKAAAGAETISFNISESAPWVITLASDLPLINSTMTLDATTQPGWSSTDLIQIVKGGTATTGIDMLLAHNSEIYGFEIHGFNASGDRGIDFGSSQGIQIGSAGKGNIIRNNYYGIYVNANSATIQGNKIGTMMDGATASSNQYGIYIDNSDNNLIGGENPGEGNLISGNVTSSDYGIWIRNNSDANIIYGNLIGTTADGLSALPNYTGIRIDGGSNHIIGGAASGQGNVISGNNTYGIRLIDGVSGVVIKGNLIGTDINGTGILGNTSSGVVMGFDVTSSAYNTILGGSAAGEGNTIVGSGFADVRISNGTGNIIQGNKIGVDVNGDDVVNTTSYGIHFSGFSTAPVVDDNIIGGVGPGEGNIIAGFANGGIFISPGGGTANRNTIRGNQIYCNTVGINLQTGANQDIAPPAITNYTTGAGTSTVTGTCSTCSAGNLIDVYRDNSACEDGQGAEYLGTVTFVGDPWSLGSLTLSIGDIITAQVTDASGNTSEFFPAVPEIEVYQGVDNTGTLLADAVSSVDFGSTPEGTPVDITFAIENTGLGMLNLTLPLSVNSTGFSILSQPSSASVAPFTSETFVVRLDASTIGTFSNRQVRIDSDDSDEGTYTFNVFGAVVDPYIVTNTNDSGTGSLRWAIDNANSSLAKETISFNIGESAPWIITLGTALPTINNPNDVGMIIDGTTQPGWTFGDPNAMVILDGETNSINNNGLTIQEPNVEIYGFVIDGFFQGIRYNTGSNDLIIGASGAGNIIKGCSGSGIISAGNADNMIVQGNYIGLSIDGLSTDPNLGTGIHAQGDNVLIGGNRQVGEGNVISGNGTGGHEYGISVEGGDNIQIYGNLIGTNKDGNNDLGNLRGIRVRMGSTNTLIGGQGTGQGNVIAGTNSAYSVYLEHGTGTIVDSNIIGMNADGTVAIPNTGNGIDLTTTTGTGTIIQNNTIANSTGAGIYFDGLAAQPAGSTIGINSYYCNGTEAIEFSPTPTVDPPVITLVTTSDINGTSTVSNGSVQVYQTNAGCGDNQGAVYLGSATVSGGTWNLNGGPFGLANSFVATYSDDTNGISEFSAAETVATAPNDPTNLTIVETSTTQIDLTWDDNSSDETDFVIERATDYGFTQNLQTFTLGSDNGTSTASFSNTSLLSAETAYFYRVKATNGGGDSGYTNIKVGTTITDSGNALDFDGVDDYIDLGNDPDFYGHPEITIEAWVKPDYTNISGHGVIATTHAFGGPGGGYQMVVFPDGTIQFLYRDNTFTNRLVVSSQSLSSGLWYHVAGVVENAGANSNVYLFINGQLEVSLVGAAGVPDYTNASNLFLGSNGDGEAGGNSLDREFGGEMDEVRMWSSARSQADIQNSLTNRLVGNESDLVAYYRFDQGVGGGNNLTPAVNLLPDRSQNQNDGVLNNFTLNNSNSNWVDSDAILDPFVVINTQDSGIGSLRWAITNANSSFGETISFDIPTAAPWIIQIDSNLPNILTTTIIDGTTQPGWSSTNLIGIQQGNTVCNWGLAIQANDCEVYGLEITGFNDAADFGGLYTGLAVTSGQIGAPLKGNVLSNNRYGLQIQGDNMMVQGNKFGTDNTGSFANGNTDSGVYIVNGEGNTIGGAGANEGNLLSGNTFYGVGIFRSDNNVVQGNIIGMNASGLSRIQNGIRGINIGNTGSFVSNGNTIGGAGVGEGNLISGNFLDNLRVIQGSNNIIQGNSIGVDSNGDIVGSAFYGIWIGGTSEAANDNIIGGVAPGEGNVIVGHPTRGVWVDSSTGSAVRNSIRGNSIYCNGELGITLEAGANNDIVAPTITTFTTGAGTSTVSGTCATCSTGDLIDVYRDNSTCADGQGEEYLGTTTFGSDPWSIGGLTLLSDDLLTVTVTDISGNTSEFRPAEPEIVVYEGVGTGGTEITDAQVSVIDIGTSSLGSDIFFDITIENTGAALLNISSISSTSLQYSFVAPPSSVLVGGFSTFTLQLDASSSGTFPSTITINSDDGDENPFTFSVTGEIIAPEISVYQGTDNTGTIITDAQVGDIDFGSAEVTNDITLTFAIENTGDDILNVTSITSSGAEFSITGEPTTVGIGATETFDITLDGSSSGVFNSTVTINSDDEDENPFTFNVTGEIVSAASPEIEVYVGQIHPSTILVDGQATEVDLGKAVNGNDVTVPFFIENTGGSDLTISSITADASEFTILGAPTSVAAGGSETFDIVLDGSVTGTFNAIITINSDDADENPFTFPVMGQITEPEIEVYFGNDNSGTPITNGQANEVDIGSSDLGNDLSESFAIENLGFSVLTISSITSSDPNFTINSAPSTVGEGATEIFFIDMDASDAGTFTTTITITNDDLDEGSFTFQVSGSIVESLDIVFYDEGVVLLSGSNIDFGETKVDEPLTRSFTIENPSSSQTMAIASISVDNSEFSVVGAPSSLSPNESASFDVILAASAKGVFNGTLTIESDFEPFSLLVSGEVTPRNNSIHVFNVVTPNGDGVHDFMRIQRITEHPNNKVFIFNRTGKLLYEASGYNNEDIRFEGRGSDGKTLLAGTYYYVIELDGSEREAGFIQIITN